QLDNIEEIKRTVLKKWARVNLPAASFLKAPKENMQSLYN
ncbi:24288_t:CDS:1, partial [Racocetra persica]